uniref:GATA-type domain-containing protein n=1 Tax=Angiostrongylus cantonensis TaxID=6313 RepID=A0A0K0DQ02_ANGCA
MRMYPSSSRSELEVSSTASQLPTLFSLPSTAYLSQSHSSIDYLPNSYSPPPQDPAYQTNTTTTAAVPCHSNSICANCKTTETTLWRRAKTGEIECNACNLYFRKNNTKRPMSLCKDTIMKRNRKPRADTLSTSAKHSVSGR